MNMDHSELQKRHFAALKEKYQVAQYQSSASNGFLYLILRKAELNLRVTKLELKWLAENRLFKAIEIICLQQYQVEDKRRLEDEFLQLRTKYHVPEDLKLSLSNPVYSVLWKIDSECAPTDSELELLSNYDLVDTVTLIQRVLEFSKLKVEYKATNHLNKLPEEPLYSILKKLDASEKLSDTEAQWLSEEGFEETLKIHRQQENERKAELEFLELKSKYQIDHDLYISISSPLYSILKKLNLEKELGHSDCEWLKQHSLNELIAIDRDRKNKRFFVELKAQYRATQYQSSDPSSRLFLILRSLEKNKLKASKISRELKDLVENAESQISEENIRWLSEEGLFETAEIAKQIHFKSLKIKYRILGQLAADPFYEIMLKLEREERLDPKQVIQLIEEGCLSPSGRIAIAYYRLEAIFYEKEYQQTKNRWNLASASSNWRKAGEPDRALEVTENVNWSKVQESDLKSALWVTRGAAFRDLEQLNEAKKCAEQAMECQPSSHQPYTLMGAVCYDLGEYMKGDEWFRKAIERGAKDTDDEIERIVRMTKDRNKRREAAQYLLKKDSKRYGWANLYLK